MAGSPSQSAIKTRIITHMNADHANSLRLFLQHYCGVPETQTKTARLTDITLDHIVVESGAGRNLIPLDPPMGSFSEARERMVGMHHEAMKGLGLSDVVVDEWVGPRKLWEWGITVLSAWCFSTLPFPEVCHPDSGSLVSYVWSLGGLVPGLAKLASYLSTYVLAFMLVAHGIEAAYMGTTKLRRHQVKFGSSVWWSWVGNALLSGVGCFSRLDGLIADKEMAAKKGSKH